ncbi:hypothetical protein CVT26_010492 [Gymnopilus dilepis]|uniref:Protein kinase domain-containing protein n=1 Tax=Gymnopilus dilepis TaxID=231916 RepID=A0A409W502_9AGAR|nr:hypothetical protein CVT26_010492 [Gymnopilus dilepis]
MAHTRRSPQHRAPSSSISSPSATRRNTLRRSGGRLASHASSQFVTSPLPKAHRPVLVPLHPNLRRLPSRVHLGQKEGYEQLMRDSSHVTTGSKRKRVESSNENAHAPGIATRGTGRKRLRTAVQQVFYRDDSQSELSEMEVDTTSALSSDSEDSEGSGDENYDSSDDYLINSAPPRTLNRLLKQRLVELYELSGLAGDAEALTKSDIIDAIVNHRDDHASVPPSSPPGKVDGASSEYSSDDGHVAGDEETDAGASRPLANGNALKRRVTVHLDLGKSNPRPLKGRSFSMGNLGQDGPSKPLLSRRKPSVHLNNGQVDGIATRLRTSSRCSPTTSATTSSTKVSPPATRLRSRNVSTGLPTPTSPTTRSRGKAKAKQVEFNNAVEVHLQTPPKKVSKGKEKEPYNLLDSGSELTELEDDTEPSEPLSQPSPRRLRSKDRDSDRSKGKSKEDPDATPVAQSKRRRKQKVPGNDKAEKLSEGSAARRLRFTPMRKAKGRIGSLKESDLEEEQLEDELVEEEGEEQDSDVAEERDTLEEDEVDELVSSASITPPPSHGRRTPVRRRLRPRRNRRKSVPTVEEENEGDDEEEEEDPEEREDDEAVEDDEEVEDVVEEDDDEATIAVEPRKLRSGKIVGEEDVEMDVDGESVADEEDEEEGEGDQDVEEAEEAEVDGIEEKADDEESVDMDAEGEQEEGETTEEDVDLSVATAKTLVRMRRDALVRLCEARDLEPSGTKPQLAEALLQWRDQHGNGFSSPSSAGTVKASSKGSTKRRRRIKHHHSSSTNTTVPVLLRSEHAHTDEPRTPVPEKEKEKENEELELDLESLGLEDREIPPEKLTKLEKIGSGGFKDVYIGKFKNRKIAISEFRGQLSPMDIKELKLLGAFNHPNIVRFLGVSIPENTKETPVMIISELCSNGDLFDYIRNTHAPSLYKVLNMMLDIARGLEYLHSHKPSIIHRDCKSSNILITAKGTAKIADFGLAKVKQSTRSMVRSLVGTVNWQAPELWTAHPKYNHKVDVFSCAMVYWEMLQWHQQTKKFPWEGMNEHAIYEVVGAKRQRPSVSGLRKQWCPEVVDLIERMWAHEPQDRPTMSEVVSTLEDLVKLYRS